MSTPEGKPHAGPSGLMRAALGGAALLVVAGAAAFYYATQAAQRTATGEEGYHVAVTAKACEPNEITVPAGKRTFRIVNRSDRPVEWEILDGVMVVEERENIAPGFSQTMSARLQPGDYEITCGLLSNPRGVLHVTPSDEAVAAATGPTIRAFLGPLSEYKVFLAMQGSATVKAAQELADALRTGDLDAARELYGPARLAYKTLEPVAYRFSDIESAVNPLALYLEKREQDPAFTGFHRIEYGLFKQNSPDGLADVADRLVADLTTLKDRLRNLKLNPVLLIDSAGRMADQLASGRIAAGEEAYAHDDLVGVEANLEGIGKIAGLMLPVMQPSSPDATAAVKAALDEVRKQLAALKGPQGFPSYDVVDGRTRDKLAGAFGALAAALEKLDPAIRTG